MNASRPNGAARATSGGVTDKPTRTASETISAAREAARDRARAEGRVMRRTDVDEALRALDDGVMP